MNIIDPYYEILTYIDGVQVLRHIERCARTCYQSCAKQTDDSCFTFVKMLLDRQHESCLEHYSFSVRIVADRGVHNELVRHRLASFSAESSRYCNYSLGKFGNEVVFIRPVFKDDPDQAKMTAWEQACLSAEKAYMDLLSLGCRPEEARSVLPMSIRTETVITANLREWRHIFQLRTSPLAHPQMRQIMIPLLQDFQSKIPVIFDSISV